MEENNRLKAEKMLVKHTISMKEKLHGSKYEGLCDEESYKEGFVSTMYLLLEGFILPSECDMILGRIADINIRKIGEREKVG